MYKNFSTIPQICVHHVLGATITFKIKYLKQIVKSFNKYQIKYKENEYIFKQFSTWMSTNVAQQSMTEGCNKVASPYWKWVIKIKNFSKSTFNGAWITK